jgi:hypothetical protein
VRRVFKREDFPAFRLPIMAILEGLFKRFSVWSSKLTNAVGAIIVLSAPILARRLRRLPNAPFNCCSLLEYTSLLISSYGHAVEMYSTVMHCGGTERESV